MPTTVTSITRRLFEKPIIAVHELKRGGDEVRFPVNGDFVSTVIIKLVDEKCEITIPDNPELAEEWSSVSCPNGKEKTVFRSGLPYINSEEVILNRGSVKNGSRER